MLSLLWLRGFRGRDRLAEAAELAKHLLEVCTWRAGGPLPEDWKALRPVLDSVVYLVERELMPRGPIKGRGRRPSICDSILDWLAEEELRHLAVAAVERLAVPQRLVCKLKHADAFYSRWEDGDLALRPDEMAHLLQVHRGRTLGGLMAEFRARVAAIAVRQKGKVPSEVMAWLLGRATGDAVDAAYRAIRQQLRNAAPPGAVFVSKAIVRGWWPGVGVAVAVGSRWSLYGTPGAGGATSITCPSRNSGLCDGRRRRQGVGRRRRWLRPASRAAEIRALYGCFFTGRAVESPHKNERIRAGDGDVRAIFSNRDLDFSG